jgi:BlaI family penicillinase repressor
MPRKPSKTFTDKELEIMRVLWERGEATAREIQESLPGRKHYNSVLTIIRVLERKRHITHRVEGRAHVYRAKESRERSSRRVLGHLVEHIFGGSTARLVLHLIEDGELTPEEVNEIRRKVAARARSGGKE